MMDAIYLAIERQRLLLSGDIETNPGPISVSELEVALHDLVDWERFAIHLPMIDHHDTGKISRQYSDVNMQKHQLYKMWVDMCKDASWDHVVEALRKIKEYTLADRIKKKVLDTRRSNLKKKNEKGVAESDQSPRPPAKTLTDKDRHSKASWSWSLKTVVAINIIILAAVTGTSADQQEPPTQQESRPAPQDKELLDILSSIPVTTQLQTFCINLGLPPARCSDIFDDPTIRGDFNTQRHRMLRLWGEVKERTWEDFVKALDTTGYHQKAKELAERYQVITPTEQKYIKAGGDNVKGNQPNLPPIPEKDHSNKDEPGVNSDTESVMVSSCKHVLAVLLGYSIPEHLNTHCVTRELNPSRHSSETKDTSKDNMKPDVVYSDPDGYFEFDGIIPEWRWEVTATDRRTGISVESRGWESRDGARKHALKDLMEKLKAHENKRLAEREKLITSAKAKIEAIVRLQKYKEAKGIVISIEMSDSCGSSMIANKQTIQDKLGLAIYTIIDPTSDEISILIEAISKIEYPVQYESLVLHYSGQGGVNNFNQLFINPFMSVDNDPQLIIDRDVLMPLKDVNHLTRLFLFNCCTSLCDINSKANGSEVIVYMMSTDQSTVSNPHCYVCRHGSKKKNAKSEL